VWKRLYAQADVCASSKVATERRLMVVSASLSFKRASTDRKREKITRQNDIIHV
jgi:hypothetical protein